MRENGELSAEQLTRALHDVAPRAHAGRCAVAAERRAEPYPTDRPGEAWKFGFLIDAILTRDPWIHRADICRATGRTFVATPEHDGRIVADVVADWARRHGAPFTLVLEGPAGGAYHSGDGGEALRIDAVEFCRVLSGRGAGHGLLATWVPF